MRLTRFAFAKAILVVSLALGFMIIFGFQNIAPSLEAPMAAPAAAALPPDPSLIGQWSSLMPMNGVVAIHIHVLPNGKVLFWQRKDTELTTDTHLWDPATGGFTQIPNPYTQLFCSGHAFLPDGRLLVSGGHHFLDGDGEPHTNIFDFNTNTWIRVADMNAGRWYPTNTTLANGEVLTVSGIYWDGTLDPTGNHHHVINQVPQVWQTTGGWRSLSNALKGLPLYPMMLLAPDGRVFNCGPDNLTLFLDTNGAGSWTNGPGSQFGYRESGTSVMYGDGKVMITGGGSPPTNTTEVINLLDQLPRWRYVASMAFARRRLNATILPDGKVLVTGGTSAPFPQEASQPILAAEMWDPATETWSTLASMQERRLYHSTAALLPDGRVLSAGGGMPPGGGTLPGGGTDTDHPNAEIYSPPYLFKGPRPTITAAPAGVNYGKTFFVQTPNATSITKVTLIRLSSVTHAFNQNQRINHLGFTQGAGGLNVTAPMNGNLCPPGHYMLFILNDAGVPSVAKIVQVQESPNSSSGITITCDNGYDLYFNGGYRGSGSNWFQSQTYDLTLQPGKNVVAIRGVDAGGVAGLLAELRVAGQRLGSNVTWKVSLTAPPNWADVNFDDSGWANATDYGPYGVGPWVANVSGMPPDTPARWIWSSNNDAHDVVYFRMSFMR
ncbi:MAG TPA: galactose oxidase-like domain-containing protein [Blastocatellia bacterium]|jgi:Domain of unknown function (DUF1929)./Glyoxal oxidase N-terminus.